MQRIRIALAGVVTGVWLVGYVLSYTSGAAPPTELSGLMAVVLAWAFTGQVRDSLRRGREGDDES